MKCVVKLDAQSPGSGHLRPRASQVLHEEALAAITAAAEKEELAMAKASKREQAHRGLGQKSSVFI